MARPASLRAARLKLFKKTLLSKRARILLVILFVFVLLFASGYHYRRAIFYYLNYKTQSTEEEDKLHALRNFQVMSMHEGLSVGFDVSQYQGSINWFLTDSIDDKFALDFVFIRATAGNDAVDKRFHENWKNAKEHGFMRGAYHYYRPNENSAEQAANFIRQVKLSKGDLPPVLDIEKLPEEQSIDSLKAGLKRWLSIVEKHYKVRPIIYSGESYYNDFLEDEFSEYNFWIANYNFFVEEIDDRWQFWQFTESAILPGVSGKVDVNIFNGSKDELKKLRKK